MSTVKPGHIDGSIQAPGSKSEMQRIVALSLLADSPTTILNPSLCDDALASLNIAFAFGADVQRSRGKLTITPNIHQRHDAVSCGESGTAMRIFSAVAASFNEEITLHAEGTLTTRPMDMIQQPLRALGAKCHLDGTYSPITIQGPMAGGLIEIDGSLTSQFLSGLLISLPRVSNDSQISVTNLKSIPYVTMTIDCIRRFGGTVEHDKGHTTFNIRGGQRYHGITTPIEGDWSGASFMLVAGALSGRVEVLNLSMESAQADKAIIDALSRAGAHVDILPDTIEVKAHELRAFEFDATHCPDLFPPLVSLAVGSKGTSRIRGVHRLIHKESNRADALIKEFTKLGISITQDEDSLLVTGGQVLGGAVSSHGDHRIAMATAISALSASGEVTIRESECVSKSYPSFFSDLESIRSSS